MVLDELDKELEARGHRFCRYADDSNIYVRSRRAGERVMAGISRFITGRLKLKVNESKSAVDRPQNRSFLGFSFTGGKSANRRKIAPKAMGRFKARVKELTRRNQGRSLEQVVSALDSYLRGWMATLAFAKRRQSCATWTAGFVIVFDASSGNSERSRRRADLVSSTKGGIDPTRH